MRDNVDTDELIPVSENTRVSQTGWGDGLFAGQRYLPGARGEAGRVPDPAFILNRPPFNRAAVVDPPQKRSAQLRLERLDLLGQRRLRHPQPFCRTRDVAAFRDRAEIPQVAKFHLTFVSGMLFRSS